MSFFLLLHPKYAYACSLGKRGHINHKQTT